MVCRVLRHRHDAELGVEDKVGVAAVDGKAEVLAKLPVFWLEVEAAVEARQFLSVKLVDQQLHRVSGPGRQRAGQLHR
eukprot:scaffold647801_cov34-Prasinocladus_malaysianus.AAC.1